MIKRNRGTYALTDTTFDVIYREHLRLGVSLNAALNVLLIEVLEWRAGQRRAPRRKAQPVKAAPSAPPVKK